MELENEDYREDFIDLNADLVREEMCNERLQNFYNQYE